jgi:hypothetical protein
MTQETFENEDSIAFKQIENTSEYWEYSKFILKYPESKYFNLALDKYHKSRDVYYDSVGMPIIDCFRNCASIQIKANQQIIYEHELINQKNLQDSLLKFFCNDINEEYKPEKKYTDDVYGRPQEISKGHVQLQYINDSCAILQSVVKDIHHSISSYKNYLSRNWYQKEFKELGEHEKHHMDSLLENRLILFGWDKECIVPPPPPPPRPSMHEKYWTDSLSEVEMEELEKALNEYKTPNNKLQIALRVSCGALSPLLSRPSSRFSGLTLFEIRNDNLQVAVVGHLTEPKSNDNY